MVNLIIFIILFILMWHYIFQVFESINLLKKEIVELQEEIDQKQNKLNLLMVNI